nr:hypothetical protein [Clostridia bacterium]
MKITKLLRVIVSIPKTIYFNFRVLPFPIACKMPFFLAYDVKLGALSGKIKISAPTIRRFTVRIGLGGSENIQSQKGYFSCGKNAEIVFSENVAIGAGNSIMVADGTACFGSGFTSNKNCTIACSAGLHFGEDVMLGYKVSIRDSDGHPIVQDGVCKLSASPIDVGSHVWLCSETHLLKGCMIPEGSILGYGSIALGKYKHANSLIAGYPAKEIQQGISWER